MRDGGLLRNAVQGMEDLVRDKTGIGFEGIQFRDVAPDEDVQVAVVQKTGAVHDDAPQEFLVLLVAAQLLLPVLSAGDQHRLQAQGVFQDEHVRIKTKLPAGILHEGRDDDLEAEVDPAVPLGHVPETGGNHGRIQDIRGHHFTGGLVLDRLHDEHRVATLVLHREGIPAGNRDDFAFLLDFVPGQGERGRQLLLTDLPDLPCGPTSKEERQDHRHGGAPTDCTTCLHLRKSIG